MENKHVQTTESLKFVPLVFHGPKVQKATGTPCAAQENFSAPRTDLKNKLPRPLLSHLTLSQLTFGAQFGLQPIPCTVSAPRMGILALHRPRRPLNSSTQIFHSATYPILSSRS